MSAVVWIVVGVALVALVVAVVAVQLQRSRQLRQTFGPEYDRAVEDRGGRREAERELSGRFERRKQLDIRPLAADRREQYGRQWRDVQARFVDAPGAALQEADTLVIAVMRECGYPESDFEQRAADVSVDHAGVVGEYRSAHAVALRSSHGEAGTEDLRQAMVQYRAVFDALVAQEAPARG